MRASDLVDGVRGLGKLGLGVAKAFAWLPPLLARLSVGLLVMLPSTWTDKSDLGDAGVAYLKGLPSGLLLVGGCLLIVGLGSRLVALGLAAVMVVGLFGQQHVALDSAPLLEVLSDYIGLFATNIALLLIVVVFGPGPVSLDRAILGRLVADARVAGQRAPDVPTTES